MTEKTALQVERMKLQSFGTEVECNHIQRHQAATLAAGLFGTDRAEDTSARNGYECQSAWDDQGREWRFQRDSSIQGPDGEKCEVISPVLQYGDIPLLQALMRNLRRAGARSCPSIGCGVHIHVGIRSPAGDHTPATLRNLVNMMAAHEEQLGRAIRLDSKRKREYCKAIAPAFVEAVNKEKPQTMEKLAEIWYKENEAVNHRDARYNSSRYHMLNLHSVFTRGTIEFRMFQFDEAGAQRKGGLHAGALKAYIQLCLAMSEMAKEVKYASCHPQQEENDKYAMRCWLMRLGFVGDEFRTARKILLRNMEGCGAWRERTGGPCGHHG